MNLDRALLTASWNSWISPDNRERAGPWWLAWLWTLLFGMALAVPFTVAGFLAFGSGNGAWRNLSGWAYWYGKNLVVSLSIALLIHALFDAARCSFASPARLTAWRPWQRTLFFAGVPMLGVALGWPLGLALAGLDVVAWFGRSENADMIVGTLLLSLIITFVLHTLFSAHARRIEADQRATEAQLRLLQAQIEPHFLFNTLANVQSLIEHDTPRAQQMLAAFTDYLRSSLGALRAEQSPLAQELALARSYLLLLQMRMDERLRFSIDADDAASRQPLPPLLLQPLVENAVMHGLEPSIEGGSVTVSARVTGSQLVLEVRDDGRGLHAPARRATRPGAGMALANIRQRLLARYGSAASLELLDTNPGTCARITLPLKPLPTKSPT